MEVILFLYKLLQIQSFLQLLFFAQYFATGFYEVFIVKGYNYPERYGKDSWAVVTGSTDGIGLELCRSIAKRGLNVVLISRTESKLVARCSELSKEFPEIKFHYVVGDFSANTSVKFYEEIFEKLEDKDVSMLFNNVGSFATKMGRASKEDLRASVAINCYPAVLLTKVFTQSMIRREKKSAIVNVGSVSSKVPSFQMAPYCATKSFAFQFMMKERKVYGHKIDFFCAMPGWVTTKMIPNRKVDQLTITVEDATENICRLVGSVSWSPGHWKHHIFRLFYPLHFTFGWRIYICSIYKLVDLVQKFTYSKKKNVINKEKIK